MHLNTIICGDCLEVLPKLPRAKCIFADPPDNLGMRYDGFVDKWRTKDSYLSWLSQRLWLAYLQADVVWASIYHKWLLAVWAQLDVYDETKLFLWRFTFGQHNKQDCGNGYRPILRLVHKHIELYPDRIRVPSARQLKYNDKRANPKGRVPDDVWEFPRVCGTFKEKKKWHPNQHPKELLRRIIRFSCKPGDLFIDMFAGTGGSLEACKEEGVNFIGIDISPFYCQKISEEQGIPILDGQMPLWE